MSAPHAVFAQAAATATHTQWDIFAATGGNGTATQNVASILRDASGVAGPAGSVWFTGQNPEPRLGRLDPDSTTNNYTEWRPFTGVDNAAGAPLGLAVNAANGDLWIAVQGAPSVLLKQGFSNNFRRFDGEQPLVPQGLAVASDNSLYLALPEVNAYGQGQAIVNVPRNVTSSSVNLAVWRFDQVGGAPMYLAIDAAGDIWFTDRLRNLIGRLTPSTNVVKEWPLPTGTNPIGLQLSGTTACVISDGLAQQAGVAQCLDASANQFTIFAASGMNRPQQLARNSFAELFVTEWNGDAIVFLSQEAYGAATTVTVQPVTRTVTRGSYTLGARDITVVPVVRTIVPSVTTVTGTNVGNGQTRFNLPMPELTYPFALTGHPQPFGITAAFNDFERGSGTAYLAEYFLGPWGRFPAARIDKYEVVAARVINTSTSSLQFTMTTGGTAPVSQTLALTEANGLSLNWTVTSSKPWVTVSAVSGSAPSSIVISVDPTLLGVGTHTATLTFDDGPAKADPRNVSITFTIESPPTIDFSLPELTFSADSDDTTVAPVTFAVTNAGGGTLDCSATSSQTWIVVTEPSSCTFSVALTPLPSGTGTHEGTITVTAPGATNSGATLDVSFTRNPPPDTTAPVLTLPANLTVEATSAAGAVVVYTATALDAISGSSTPSCSPAPGTTFALGTTTVTCSATDASGNSTSGSFTITVRDTTAPSLTVPANITTEATTGSGVPVTFTVSATDFVSGALTPVCAPASGSTFPGGTTTVTCTATDGAGNPATASFTVTVPDSGAPVLNLPAGITTPLTNASGAVVTYSATATDPAGGPAPAVSCSPASGSTFPVGATTVTCTATSGSRQTTGQFTVTVTGDTTAPVLTLPGTLIAEATGASGAAVSYTVSALDAISGALTPSCSLASGSTFALGNTPVTCTAADAAGNQASGAFTVTVRDTTAPTVTVPANIVKEATGPTGATATFAATATDLVGGALVPSCSPASGSTFGVTATTVTCTATDASGNAASKSFTVTVQDTTAPVLTLPGSVSATSANGSSVAVTFAASATDLVSGTRPVTCTPASGTLFNVGTTTVNCSASDAKGNSASGSFTVVVTASSFSVGSASMYFKTGRLAYCNGIAVGPNWKDQGLAVTNTGTAPITIAATTLTPWIKVPAAVTLAAGASQTLTVSVDLTALGRGIYQGSLLLTGNAVVKTVPVTLEIGNALPTLCLTPKVMGWGQIKGGATSTTQVFDITNAGDDPMANFTTTKSASDGTVIMSASSGTAPKAITISVKAGKKRGGQSGTINISVPGAVQGNQTISLSWTVK